MKKRVFALQFGFTSLGRLAAAVLQATLLILLARAVSPSEFGLISSVLGLSLVAQAAVDLGLSTFVMKERASNPENGIVTAALTFNNHLSLAMSLLAGTLLVLSGFLFNPAFWFMMPLAIWMSAERNADTWLGVIFADGDWKLNFFSLLLKRIAALPIYIFLGWYDVNPILAFSAAVAFPSAIVSVYIRMYIGRLLPLPTPIKINELIAESWPYWINSLATHAKNFDVLLTAMIASPFQAGIYASSSRLTSPLRILPTSLAKTLMPAASRLGGASIWPLFRLTLAMVGVMTLFYSAVFLALPPILPSLLGEEYRPASSVLQIIVAGLPFAAGTSLFGSILQGTGQKNFVAKTAVNMTVIHLLLLVPLTWFFGAPGAASAMTASFFLHCVVMISKIVSIASRVEPLNKSHRNASFQLQERSQQ